MDERVGQLGLERVEELAARGGGCIRGARAADEDDAGGEGVGASADASGCSFRPHRPGAADGKAGADDRVEEGLPARAGGAVCAVALGLLEGVVDGDWEGRVRLLGEAVHRLRHAIEKEGLCLLLAAVAIGAGDQFLGLGYGERGEEVGEDGPQRAAQPDVEEVRQVGVADVVVVGRVGGDDLAAVITTGLRIA